MKKKYDQSAKNSIGRLIFVAISILIQIVWLMLLVLKFNESGIWISAITKILTILVVLEIIYTHQNAAFKLPWVILILAFPIVGVTLCLITGHFSLTKARQRKFERIGTALRKRLKSNVSLPEETNPVLAGQMCYIQNDSGYPADGCTSAVYYGDTCKALDALIADLQKAKHFIFMEYHAIENAKAFGRIRAVLAERAAHGVEVRLIYDDIGSVGFINPTFVREMEADGIQCRVFNPLVPVINVFMNNRDHRKITVIDGQVGFTGGYNLADEYFNIVHPYGEWKDTGIRLEGMAVQNFTVQFLEMWNTVKETDKEGNFSTYFPPVKPNAAADGFVQPYGDSPLDDVYLGENVYMNLLKGAQKYTYIMTPYLILDDELCRELTLAARRGVDVRILTPGIPDKKIVYTLTRSYYHHLVKSGVRIYEFTPGFLHAKQCLCDGKAAAIGTINLDFRSLYFHFENAVFLTSRQALADMHTDFLQTMERSCEVTEQYRTEPKGMELLRIQMLRLFAPLM